MRLNARLDANVSSKLDYLVQQTGLSISEVVRHAIENYYQEIHQQADPLSIFEDCNFIGTAELEPEFSSQYKQSLKESWTQKYDYR